MRSFRTHLLCSLLLCLILCAILPACDRGQEPNSPSADVVTATPEEVLAPLAPEATPLAISDVCTRIVLPEADLLTVRDAFLGKGFGVIPTDSTPSTKLETVVLKNGGWLVTLLREGTSVQILWESMDAVTPDPLYAESDPPKGEVTMVQMGIPQDEMATGNPMIGMCYIYRLADGTALIIFATFLPRMISAASLMFS